MWRVLICLCALVLAAGCRTPESNPFAAFGPSTIPPPTIEMPGNGSYYTTPGAAGSTTPPAANSLPSISVPSGVSGPQPPAVPLPATPQPSVPRPYSFGSLAPRAASPSFTTEPGDREPIRIVEAAPSEARVATAPPRAATPGVVEAAPAARDPIRAFNNSSNRGAIEPYVPTFGQPPARGFKSSGQFRTDEAIRPATYLEAAPASVGPADAGGWRVR
jgi:hypothetical protein